jgi:hypothetical protein
MTPLGCKFTHRLAAPHNLVMSSTEDAVTPPIRGNFMTYHYKTLGLASAVALSMLAGGAQAATLQVELWDVLAPEPGCCTGNDESDQILARGFTPENTIALRPVNGSGDTISPPNSNNFLNADFFSGAFESNSSLAPVPNDWAGVDYIVGLSSDLMFNIDSSELQSGFTNNVNLASDSANPTIDSFFNRTLGGVGENSILGTVVRITGMLSVQNGDTFDVTTDDGVRLTLGGNELLFDPTLNDTQTMTSTAFGGASGPAAFELLWFEGNTIGAHLQVEGNFTPVPLPASALLLLGGLGGLGGLSALRRRKRTA